jgi:hypothetical protein
MGIHTYIHTYIHIHILNMLQDSYHSIHCSASSE